MRRQKLEAQLQQLESDFRNLLVDALKKCAAGEWGMFGQNDAVLEAYSPQLQDRLKSRVAEKLLQLGEEVTTIRTALGIQETFAPFAMYLKYRQHKSSNDLGEPRLAAQFLADLSQS